MCCVEGNIYLVGAYVDVGAYAYRDRSRRVTEYNPHTNTWKNMPSLQQGRVGRNVCTFDNKIFVLGSRGLGDTSCEMLDLSDVMMIHTGDTLLR